MRYNTNEIMREAHAATAAAVHRHPGADYRATFAAALRGSWEDARITATSDTAAGEELAALTGEAVYNRLRAMIGYCRRRDGSLKSQTGAYLPPVFDRLPRDDDYAIANEAYIRMVEAIERGTDRSLAGVMFYAVLAAARSIIWRERRHPSAMQETTGEDGDAVDLINTAAGAVDRISVSPEEFAAVRDAVVRACHDSKDREIVGYLVDGYTQTETGRRVNLGQRAVAQRVSKIRERYHAAV